MTTDLNKAHKIISSKAPKILLPDDFAGEADEEGLAWCFIEVEGKAIKSVASELSAGKEVSVDASDSVLLPGFLDAHVHLDKAHSWFRAPNRSGTFQEALEVLWHDKSNWTAEDVYRRAGYALECAYAYGSVAARTHVDTGFGWAERSYEALAQLRGEWAGRLDLQLVSLCMVEGYSAEDGEALADLPLRYGASALGGMPVMNRELDAQLDRMMALAAERGVGLDLHVDESGNPEASCLAAVARAVLRNEFPNTVVCGHCCSLAVKPLDEQLETLNLVQEAGIRIVSLPMCNLYLQDRRSSEDGVRTPSWRGITLAHEFMERGVPLACASDNVRDAFYAFGDFDMLEVYRESVRIGHLDRMLKRSVEVVTAAPAELMDLKGEGFGKLCPGSPAQLARFAVASLSELLSRPNPPRSFFDGEAFREREIPPYEKLLA